MTDTIELEDKQLQNDKRIKKLKSAAKSITTLDKYTELLNDPLFNRSMLDIIVKRLTNKTAISTHPSNSNSKLILKAIVEHPLITAEDIIIIKSVKNERNKYVGNAGSSYYNSSYINSALASKSNAPKKAIISLIKIPQFDIKLKALERNDLSTDEINMIIDYSIKHHSHIPEQLKTILEATNNIKLLKDKDFKKRIINELKKKYRKGSQWFNRPTGIKFFESIIEYEWINEISNQDKEEMITVVINAYNNKWLTKNKMDNFITKLGDYSGEFLLRLYNETKNDNCLPEKVVDVFLF